MANRVLYCARETEGEEEVLEDAACRDLPKPMAVVSCNNHSCPAMYITHKHLKWIFTKMILKPFIPLQVEGIQNITLLCVL